MSDILYVRIAENVDKNPLGAPKSGGELSKAFIAYLKLLYTAEEAELVQHLKAMPRFMNAAQVAEVSGKIKSEVEWILDGVAKKGAIMKMGPKYCLPPIPMIINIHQNYPDLKPDDIKAAELYQQFFIKEGFYKYYESSEKGTPIMRVIPVKRTVEHNQKILDTEEAHKIIEGADNIAMVPCPCRTRTEKLEIRECKDKYPIGACLMTGMSAIHFESIGYGKKVTAEQAKKYLDEMQDLGLVAITENYENPKHSVICLCCDCCCSQLRGRTRWNNPSALSPSNFIPEANEDCVMCGTCVDRCFFGALSLDEKAERAVVTPDKCIGCGVCTITCAQEALKLCRIERSKPYPEAGELYKKVALENKG